MNWSSFSINLPGKWILTGEHSVLRGSIAVALPQDHFRFFLEFQLNTTGKKGFFVEPKEAQDLISGLILEIFSYKNKNGILPNGTLKIDSDIPIGAGMGSSAALCVALTRWLSQPLGLSQSEELVFATRLENRFHRRSSGMDVAVISIGKPIFYSIMNGSQAIEIQKIPKFTFHDTLLRSQTSECVLSVEQFRKESSVLAQQLDKQMGQASSLALEGLLQYDAENKEQGLMKIKKAIESARECFYSWKLVPKAAELLEKELINQGALAVKLTGAGGGGIVVALWSDHE